MTRSPSNRLPRTFLLLSRVLLLLVGILIAVIPWSERYCALDNFPNGQDVETNLLAFLTLVGLMLLLAHLCREGLAALFSLRHWISRLNLRRSPDHPYALGSFTPTPPHRAPLPSPFSAAFNLPLQI